MSRRCAIRATAACRPAPSVELVGCSHTWVLRTRRRLFPPADANAAITDRAADGEIGEDGWPLEIGTEVADRLAYVRRLTSLDVLGALETDSYQVVELGIKPQVKALTQIAAAADIEAVLDLVRTTLGSVWPAGDARTGAESVMLARLDALADAELPDDLRDDAGGLDLDYANGLESAGMVFGLLEIAGLPTVTRRHLLVLWNTLTHLESASLWELNRVEPRKLPSDGCRMVHHGQHKILKAADDARTARRQWLIEARKVDTADARTRLEGATDDGLIFDWWKGEEGSRAYTDADKAKRDKRHLVRDMLRKRVETTGRVLEFCASCHDTAMLAGADCPQCYTSTVERQQVIEARQADIEEHVGTFLSVLAGRCRRRRPRRPAARHVRRGGRSPAAGGGVGFQLHHRPRGAV